MDNWPKRFRRRLDIVADSGVGWFSSAPWNSKCRSRDASVGELSAEVVGLESELASENRLLPVGEDTDGIPGNLRKMKCQLSVPITQQVGRLDIAPL